MNSWKPTALLLACVLVIFIIVGSFIGKPTDVKNLSGAHRVVKEGYYTVICTKGNLFWVKSDKPLPDFFTVKNGEVVETESWEK